MPKLIFHGHACFEVEGSKGKIIIDPFLSGNTAAVKKPEEVMGIDAVLVTHGHGDHLGDTIDIAKQNDALVIAPAELARYLNHKGLKTHRMHIGGANQFSWGWVKLTLAVHGSGFDDGTNVIYLGNPCGFFIKMDEKIIYHAGDTGLFGDMKIFRDLLKGQRIDVAILPIGDNVVMGPDDALLAVKWMEPKMVIPMHYNTFPFIQQDPYQFKKDVESQTPAEVVVLSPGEELIV